MSFSVRGAFWRPFGTCWYVYTVHISHQSIVQFSGRGWIWGYSWYLKYSLMSFLHPPVKSYCHGPVMMHGPFATDNKLICRHGAMLLSFQFGWFSRNWVSKKEQLFLLDLSGHCGTIEEYRQTKTVKPDVRSVNYHRLGSRFFPATLVGQVFS